MPNIRHYRGKRIDNGEWVHGCYSYLKVPLWELISHYIIVDGLKPYEVDPETVGQYTGFDDFNSKKIYEGDLVKSPIQLVSYDTQPIGEICFEDGAWLVVWPKHQSYLAARVHTLEVIGNRWDNPELLSS